MKVKVTTGYRDDQYVIIDAEESHKAYYLFNNPESRTIFKNGVALIGKNIKDILPAYNETMDWNPSYKLGDDDWNEIKKLGVDKKLRDILQDASSIALLGDPKILSLPLSEAKEKFLTLRDPNAPNPQYKS